MSLVQRFYDVDSGDIVSIKLMCFLLCSLVWCGTAWCGMLSGMVSYGMTVWYGISGVEWCDIVYDMI